MSFGASFPKYLHVCERETESINISIYIGMYKYVYYTYIYMYTCLHMCARVGAYMSEYIDTYECLRSFGASFPRIPECVYLCVCKGKCVRVSVYVCACVCVHVYTCLHILLMRHVGFLNTRKKEREKRRCGRARGGEQRKRE